MVTDINKFHINIIIELNKICAFILLFYLKTRPLSTAQLLLLQYIMHSLPDNSNIILD